MAHTSGYDAFKKSFIISNFCYVLKPRHQDIDEVKGICLKKRPGQDSCKKFRESGLTL